MLVFRIFIGIIFLVLAVFITVVVYPLYSSREVARHDLEVITREWELKYAEADGLKKLRYGLENTPSVIEAVAREKFNYSRDGELIVDVGEEPFTASRDR